VARLFGPHCYGLRMIKRLKIDNGPFLWCEGIDNIECIHVIVSTDRWYRTTKTYDVKPCDFWKKFHFRNDSALDSRVRGHVCRECLILIFLPLVIDILLFTQIYFHDVCTYAFHDILLFSIACRYRKFTRRKYELYHIWLLYKSFPIPNNTQSLFVCLVNYNYYPELV